MSAVFEDLVRLSGLSPIFARTVVRRALTRLGSHPAIQVRGTETISGQPRTVRSTHVYAFGAEVVVDAYAPANVFGRIDRAAFAPLVRSLKLRAP